MTMLELTLSFGILTTILLAVFGVIERDTHLAHSTLGIAISEMKAQQMLRKIEGELANARGDVPIASLTQDLSAGETGEILVDMTLGFPPQGTLLLDRGTNAEERIAYAGLVAAQDRFSGLTRAAQCTDSDLHLPGAGLTVLWTGIADPIELQENPPENLWDGVAMQPTGPLHFRGDGSGFSYRVPVDPTDSNPPVYLDGDELQWGHSLRGTPSTDAWGCLYYAPRFEFLEAATGDDINRDGDTVDVFDVGQVRRIIWNTLDPSEAPQDIGMGPTNILQERCNWGSDLNGDGFDDPLFLWHDDNRQLHIRLYILGRTNADIPIVRSVESMVFLRNEPEN
jgi:hypothetical protein